MTSKKRSLSCLLLVIIGMTSATPLLAVDNAVSNPSQPGSKPPSNTGIVLPAAPTPILPLEQVRIGMKGYGLTVFHGVKIEPFPVVVISVMRDFAPKRGAIWVKCSDPRLIKSGPVQGMSGSPIYLWADGEKQTMGQGGKLIGAFAFGYSWTRDCYAGIQPIELMRDTGGRAAEKKPAAAPAKATSANGQVLRQMLNYAKRKGWSRNVTWKAEALARIIGIHSGKSQDGDDNKDARLFADGDAIP